MRRVWGAGRAWPKTTGNRRELDWRPAIGLKDGIAETAGWIEVNWDAERQQPLDDVHKP